VLIALGVIFLLLNFGYVSWFRIGHYFARYWPVLLILWGVARLLDRRGGQRRGLGAGGWLLLFLLLLFGILASTAARLHWREFHKRIEIHQELGRLIPAGCLIGVGGVGTFLG
jgi:hypothetical protein